jgi:uncharacterized membrane protein YozB (DUF420 family)
MDLDVFPPVNATLNGIAGVLLLAGYIFIRRKRIGPHKACMIAAVIVSAGFLASYLTYHMLKAYETGKGHTSFTGTGFIRPVYFFILITHVVLAAVNLPMVIVTLYRAWRNQFDRHTRIARWTWPIWMYVSVTGVIVYWMLYHLYPSIPVES